MVAMALIVGVLFSPPSPDVVREAAKRVLEDSAYQKEIPDPLRWRSEPRPGRDTRDRDRPIRDTTPPREAPPIRIDPPSPPSTPGSPIGRAVLWVGIAVLAVLGALWVVREFRGREREVAVARPTVAPPPDPNVVTRPLTEAEALAARGAFGPAIHALLLQTLYALAAKSSVPLPRSLTSREILAAVELPPAAREALSALVVAAEVCHFGGVPAVEPQYADCVGQFRAFVAAYVGAAA